MKVKWCSQCWPHDNSEFSLHELFASFCITLNSFVDSVSVLLKIKCIVEVFFHSGDQDLNLSYFTIVPEA
jgi:hypothetical protein